MRVLPVICTCYYVIPKKIIAYSFMRIQAFAMIAVKPPVVIPEEKILRILSGN